LLILWAFQRGELDVAQRSIGQERFGFAGRIRPASSLDELAKLIDWSPVAGLLDPIYSATKGEPAWPPLAMFKALLLSVWYDLSDVKVGKKSPLTLKHFEDFAANKSFSDLSHGGSLSRCARKGGCSSHSCGPRPTL
jgi:IS5 family transposase